MAEAHAQSADLLDAFTAMDEGEGFLTGGALAGRRLLSVLYAELGDTVVGLGNLGRRAKITFSTFHLRMPDGDPDVCVTSQAT